LIPLNLVHTANIFCVGLIVTPLFRLRICHQLFSNGSASDLWSEGDRFESRPEYRILGLSLSIPCLTFTTFTLWYHISYINMC